MGMRDWDPDEALNALEAERQAFQDEQPEDRTRRLFKENADGAAMSIVHLAHHAVNENVRLKAAIYVSDRVLGRIQDSTALGDEDPFVRFMKECGAKEKS
jgi:CHAT domain-containing protein